MQTLGFRYSHIYILYMNDIDSNSFVIYYEAIFGEISHCENSMEKILSIDILGKIRITII